MPTRSSSPSKEARATSANIDIDALQKEYQVLNPAAQNFVIELNRQIEEVLSQNEITLGVPIQSRVKTWDSIVEKIERNELDLNSVKNLHDLIGFRLILLFDRDVKTTCELLDGTFNVISREDTHDRLGETQFGYASIHYIIETPKEWLAIPTLSKSEGLRAEIQVRTIAQHIWAAASHTLQYKQEDNVPHPVRRAIHRVSALLETVDLELERVLEQRDDYKRNEPHESEDVLNVDLLQRFTDENLPAENKDSARENYSRLLEDLSAFSINTVGDLSDLWTTCKDNVMEYEREHIKERRSIGSRSPRIERGVFLTHAGMMRRALHAKVGDKWDEYTENRKQQLRLKAEQDGEQRKPHDSNP